VLADAGAGATVERATTTSTPVTSRLGVNRINNLL
jgi:hypothetical protein